MLNLLIPALAPILGKVVGNLFPDPEQKAKAEQEVLVQLMQHQQQIVARWFGWAAPNLAEAEYIKLWSIVEFGLGGYVVGRSVEKIAPGIADALKRR